MVGIFNLLLSSSGARSLPNISFVGGRIDTGTTSQTRTFLEVGGGDYGTTNPSENDYVVVFCGIAHTNDTTALTVAGELRTGSFPPYSYSNNSGAYSLIAGPVNGSDEYDMRLYCFAQKMGSTPDNSIRIDQSGGTSNSWPVAIRVMVLRDVNPDTLLDEVAVVTANAGNNGRPNPGAITPITPGAWILAGGGAAASDTTTIFAFTFTDLTYTNSIVSINEDARVRVGAGANTIWTSGSFDPAAWGGGTTDTETSWSAITLAVKPKGITYVGGKTVDAGAITGSAANLSISLTDLTGGVASAPSENDIVVIGYSRSSTGVADANLAIATTGYEEIAELREDDTYEVDMVGAWKRMGSTPDTTVSITRPATGVYVAAIQVFRGVDTTTALDVTSTTASSINYGRPDPASIEPVTDKSLIVVIGSQGSSTASVAFTSTDLNYFITRDRDGTTSGSTIGIGARYWTTGTGAFDPAEFGGGSTSVDAAWAAITLALRPKVT